MSFAKGYDIKLKNLCFYTTPYMLVFNDYWRCGVRFEIISIYLFQSWRTLTYTKDYELCIAVILSAQCTDERVNTVTPILFKTFTSLEEFANAELSEIEKLIFSTGFYKNKAKSIKGFANLLLTEYNSKLPKTIEDLMKKIDPKYWMDFSLYLIFLGRKFCKAHKTECEGCPLNDICPSSKIK